MFIFYDLIFLLFSCVYLPIYLARKKFHRSFFRRLGILPAALRLDRPIWVHAVSVGEAMAVRGLLEELRKAYPKKQFVISTVTTTGNKIAKEIARESDFVTYLPLDFGFFVKNTIDKINPSLFIIAETEIWPNLILYLYRKGIPVITVNGRISEASFRGYLSIRFLLQPILRKVSLFCVQAERDAQRLARLGVSQDKIRITGNMKFDFKEYTDLEKDYSSYREKIGLAQAEKLMIAASTHKGEEEIALGVYRDLLKEFRQLKLLLAPRHPERAKEVSGIVSKFGFRSVFLSSGAYKCSSCLANPVFILDTVGQLVSFYALADVIFVGGSLVKKGGHNILEPAALGKAVLFGPYMHNFRDIADLFLDNKAALLIHNQEEFKTNANDLLRNPSYLSDLGQRARGLILENQGASKRNAEYAKAFIIQQKG